jgi:regulatory protein YycI of two-component signal transduction system YycFG
MVLYEKKLYVALIVLLLVFLYYNFALEKLVEDEILEITEDKNAEQLKEDSENTTEKLQETTETETASTTSATTTRKWLSDLVFISAYKPVCSDSPK